MSSFDFSSQPNAGLPRRVAAIVYDLFLILAISLLYGLLVWLIRSSVEGTMKEHEIPGHFSSALIMVGWWLALASYFNHCWKKRGQTLAMKAWRLRLQQPDGTLATSKQRWCRSIIAPLSLISVAGLLWLLWDKSNGCLHDRLTGTRIVLLPKGIN